MLSNDYATIPRNCVSRSLFCGGCVRHGASAHTNNDKQKKKLKRNKLVEMVKSGSSKVFGDPASEKLFHPFF